MALAAAFALGISFCYLYAPPLPTLACGLAAACAALALLLRFRPRRAFALLLAAIFFMAALYAHAAFAKQDPLEAYMQEGAGASPTLTGRVLTLHEKPADGGGLRTLTVLSGGRVLLLRVRGAAADLPAGSPQDLLGRRVRFKGALSYPDTARNPGCFDYRLHLLSKGIRVIVTADARAIQAEPAAGPAQPAWAAYHRLCQLKYAFLGRCGDVMAPDEAALFKGMMFGDKDDIPDETYDMFRRNGAAHILAVSGLHVGIVYAFVSFALGRRRTRRYYLCALACLLLYAVLSEFSPSVTRAVLMIAVHIFSKLTCRRYDMLTGICFAALALLLLNPLALFGTGFQLSFLAVLSLAFALPFLDRFCGFRDRLTGRPIHPGDLASVRGLPAAARLRAAALGAVLPMAAIQAAVLPISAYRFHSVAPLALLLNIPVIALASLLVPMGLLCFAITCAAALLPTAFAPAFDWITGVGTAACGFLTDILARIVNLADSLPGSHLNTAAPPTLLVLLLYGIAFYLMSDAFYLASQGRMPDAAHPPLMEAWIPGQARNDRMPDAAHPPLMEAWIPGQARNDKRDGSSPGMTTHTAIPASKATASEAKPSTPPANPATASGAKPSTPPASKATASEAMPSTPPANPATASEAMPSTPPANEATASGAKPSTPPASKATASGAKPSTPPASKATASEAKPSTPPANPAAASEAKPSIQKTTASGARPDTGRQPEGAWGQSAAFRKTAAAHGGASNNFGWCQYAQQPSGRRQQARLLAALRGLLTTFGTPKLASAAAGMPRFANKRRFGPAPLRAAARRPASPPLPPQALALAAILLLCALLAAPPVCARDTAAYTFVDVGQGDCLHIRTKDGKNYLMDGGGRDGYDTGQKTLAPYLYANGVTHLDGTFVSHLHTDHFQGLVDLAQIMDIGPVYVYEASAGECKEALPGATIVPLAAGDKVLLGKSGAEAEVLYPPKGMPKDPEDENKNSLIIRFEDGGASVLMTGDVGFEGEGALLGSGADARTDVLKVGHHGSKYSTSDAFLEATAPACAVIQVGKNNTYGHPTPETLAKLSGHGIMTYRNDLDGAVLVDPAKQGLRVRTVKRDFVSSMLWKGFEKEYFERIPGD
ncbi:MAG: ComEC/Rec2 family competence protein [Clostridiales Family XIII bacterium]|nr:ComEC/Rec2 family competence protein [Clostridiales Family XIII bacterium]